MVSRIQVQERDRKRREGLKKQEHLIYYDGEDEMFKTEKVK